MLNFVRGVITGGEELLKLIGGGLLPGRIGQHHDSSLMVLALPGVQKTVRGSQSGTVGWVTDMRTRFDSTSEGP